MRLGKTDALLRTSSMAEIRKELKMKIRALLVKPNEAPKEVYIENTLEAKQEIVGGYIEVCTPILHDDTAVIICNEEGKLLGLEPNRPLYDEEDNIYDVVCGDFIILDAPEDSDDFGSLSAEQVRKYQIMYY